MPPLPYGRGDPVRSGNLILLPGIVGGGFSVGGVDRFFLSAAGDRIGVDTVWGIGPVRQGGLVGVLSRGR